MKTNKLSHDRGAKGSELKLTALALLSLLGVATVASACAGDQASCVGSGCGDDTTSSTTTGGGDDDDGTPEPTPIPPIREDDDPLNDPEFDPTGSDDPDNTFMHPADLDGETRDPFDILAQRAEEGPPEVRTRLHSCQKVNVASLRRILSSLGVNLDATGNPQTAGQLLDSGGNALGASNYGARSGETIVWTAAGAAKVFDIFVQAAPEIIANLSAQPQCQIAGVGPEVFDADNNCNRDALSCMMGVLATDEHVAICNSVVKSASDIDKGKAIAVATILSAAHSCE